VNVNRSGSNSGVVGIVGMQPDAITISNAATWNDERRITRSFMA